jgi:hypothetical protein
VIVVDYTNSHIRHSDNESIGRDALRRIEQEIARNLAPEICSRLAFDESDVKRLAEEGRELAQKMSWEAVLEKFVLPSFKKAMQKQLYAAV